MCQVAFEVPNEVLHGTRLTANDTLSIAKRATALYLYSKYGVSLGYCAQIAGMNKEDFIRFLGENEVSIFHFDDKDEFLEELANA